MDNRNKTASNAPHGATSSAGDSSLDPVVGIYIHQHWPYNHPYCARTWSFEDWRGYADGLKQLGYNTVMIWPVLETMPDPPTDSDRAALRRIGRVIDSLRDEFEMRVLIVLCPNVIARDQEAARETFEDRHFFYCDRRVNPADPRALAGMMARREELLEPVISNVNGVAIIDSDPGGYPGSSDAEFVNLLVEHRKLFDRLRPGIELYYWMHSGWQGYRRFYETGRASSSTDEEFLNCLTLLDRAAPEPWGLLNGMRYARQLGLESRVINFNYGAIEPEPSFPMTEVRLERAYQCGQAKGPRGVMGNAQTHCVQLPNLFAFARGARNQALQDGDLTRLADTLLQGQGGLIAEAWKTLAGNDAPAMVAMAESLVEVNDAELLPGHLGGLLFGNPRRFVDDMILQLRAKAAYRHFLHSVGKKTSDGDAFAAFVDKVSTWQHKHGYQNRWEWEGLYEALSKLQAPGIDEVLARKKRGDTPFERVADGFREEETFTVRLIQAMRAARLDL